MAAYWLSALLVKPQMTWCTVLKDKMSIWFASRKFISMETAQFVG